MTEIIYYSSKLFRMSMIVTICSNNLVLVPIWTPQVIVININKCQLAELIRF